MDIRETTNKTPKKKKIQGSLLPLDTIKVNCEATLIEKWKVIIYTLSMIA